MTKMAFFFPTFKKHYWPGSRLLMETIVQGLSELGHSGVVTHDVQEIVDADYIFLADVSRDLHPLRDTLKMLGRDFGVLPFYHDHCKMTRPMHGLTEYVAHMIAGNPEYTMEKLIEIPEVLQLNSYAPHPRLLNSFEVVRDAKIVLTTSPTEQETVQRECPRAHVDHFFLSPGMVTPPCPTPDDQFLDFSPFTAGSYLLYVGRVEPRKNLLSAILASARTDIPFVIIASDAFNHHHDYFNLCLAAAIKYRRAPTYIYGHHHTPMKEGSLEVIQVPPSEPLSRELILSAFTNCGLYLHPAFNELPGFVYLEAAKLGVPTVASKWCTVSDYFDEMDDRILYPYPYHIGTIEKMIHTQFGKKFTPSNHPNLNRTHAEMAEMFLAKTEAAFEAKVTA